MFNPDHKVSFSSWFIPAMNSRINLLNWQSAPWNAGWVGKDE